MGHVAYVGWGKVQTGFLVEKPEEKRPLRRHWHRLEMDIEVDFKAVGWDFIDWFYVAQDRDKCRL